MAAKYHLQVPAKTANNLTVLAAKFKDGVPQKLKWFTDKGYEETPDDIEFNKHGGKTRVKKGGWVKVSAEDFEPAPSPLKAEQVKTPATDPVVDPKAVKTVAGTDAKIEGNEAGDQSGDGGEGGDQGQKKSEGAKAGTADPKSGAKKP